MAKEIYYVVSAAFLKHLPDIAVLFPPLIDTSTRKLAEAGWSMSYRQNIIYGYPKMRLYHPDHINGASISLRLRVRGPSNKIMVYHTPELLFDAMKVIGAECFQPQMPSFVLGRSQYTVDRLRAENEALKLKAEQGQMLLNQIAVNNRQSDPPATIINGLQRDLMEAKGQIERLVTELDAARLTLDHVEGNASNVTRELKTEIAKLKTEVDSLGRELAVYENETSLETIERLNRVTYEAHLNRPAHHHDYEAQMNRIFATVNELIDRILTETNGTFSQKVVDNAPHSEYMA